MASIYEGDPRIFIGVNGAYLKWKGGQPVMDAGLENAVIISMHTQEGWAGNVLFDDPINHVGSDFEKKAQRPITRQSLLDTQDAAEKSVAWMIETGIASQIPIDVTNPTSYRINSSVLVQPPGRDAQELLLTKNGVNWQEQAINPAHNK